MALGNITAIYIALFIFCTVELSLLLYLYFSSSYCRLMRKESIITRSNCFTGFLYFGESGQIIIPLTILSSVLSLLVTAYLATTSLYITRFYNALAAFALCVITTAIWLAIFIVIVYHVGFHQCGSWLRTYCQSITAAEAFICIILVTFMILTVLKGLSIFRRPIRAIPLP